MQTANIIAILHIIFYDVEKRPFLNTGKLKLLQITELIKIQLV